MMVKAPSFLIVATALAMALGPAVPAEAVSQSLYRNSPSSSSLQRVAPVDPRSFRVHWHSPPSPNGLPTPMTSPGFGSIYSRPYGDGYFFLDATRMQRKRSGDDNQLAGRVSEKLTPFNSKR
jgi:hypothetical protein